ncbi:MAG TPA: hypothetical protein VLR46_13115 [Candidatus Dormibacteraeota bacterium]|nr:hypothetical protein [Candidatus Dormibacteraeota bacterium]
MFATFGSEAGFAEWVGRLGGHSTPAAPTKRGGWAGAELVYLQAALLLESPRKAEFRTSVEAARRAGAVVALELGEAAWIRTRGGPQTAYELAALHPDILFVSDRAASELGVPLEGIASVPVIRLEGGGCTVHGRRLAGAATGQDHAALAATFCVAFIEGAAPVEAAGLAVLVAAL